MNIALIAQDSKKELMVQFSIAYCGILSKHRLCATAGTGNLVSDATGLPVVRFLSGDQGGCEQISSRISCNEVDLLLFFTNPTCNDPVQEQNLLQIERLCDMHNVPYATNLATAEMLIMGLARGDLDWREGGGKAAPLY